MAVATPACPRSRQRPRRTRPSTRSPTCAPAPETDWSRYLFDLLPAIQACIDKTPEPDPYATKAWPMNHGMVGVRTRNGQGGWFECVAEANGKSIDRFVPLPPARRRHRTKIAWCSHRPTTPRLGASATSTSA